MCLEKITNWHKKDEGEGYKVVANRYGCYFGIFFTDRYKKHIWNKAKCFKTKHYNITGDCIEYTTGFHIFKNKEDAKCLVRGLEIILKVKYIKVIASGIDGLIDGAKTIVAKEMKIIKEVK